MRYDREKLLETSRFLVDSSHRNRKDLPARMLHRHLNHQRFTLAAIDDLISRGKWDDWAELRREALADRSLLEKIGQVCRARTSDPYAQRHHFWLHYAEAHRNPA